jgi:hypothetical protein
MNGLQKRVTRIEDQILRETIIPPSDLIPYMNGEKPDPSGARGVEFQRWLEAVGEALERRLIGPGEFLDLLPAPLRDEVIKALKRRLDHEKFNQIGPNQVDAGA